MKSFLKHFFKINCNIFLFLARPVYKDYFNDVNGIHTMTLTIALV